VGSYGAHIALDAFNLMGARNIDSFKNIAGISVSINLRRVPSACRWQISYSFLKLQLYN
jgi:hypothetical protein